MMNVTAGKTQEQDDSNSWDMDWATASVMVTGDLRLRLLGHPCLLLPTKLPSVVRQQAPLV